MHQPFKLDQRFELWAPAAVGGIVIATKNGGAGYVGIRINQRGDMYVYLGPRRNVFGGSNFLLFARPGVGGIERIGYYYGLTRVEIDWENAPFRAATHQEIDRMDPALLRQFRLIPLELGI